MYIFRMLAHSESTFEPILTLGGAILSELELDPKLRELAVLQVAIETECEYEWVQHVDVGRAVGLADEQIAAVGDGNIDDSARFNELERAVLQFTREVVRRPRVDSATFDAVNTRLTPREIVELLVTIGNYLMAARLITTLELDIDASVGMQVTEGMRSVLKGEVR
jgi:AhpD family alkylhydroperoxidase